MSSIVQACLGWFRRNLSWSNSPESWRERIGLALVVALAVLAVYFSPRLTLAQQVILWGLVLTALAVVLRRGWFRLFGPVLFYDLVRVARSSRYFLIRSIYGIFLMLMLTFIWSLWYAGTSVRGRDIRPNEMALFAETFFYVFMIVQFLVLTVLTPAYTASAIADEKERKTLEFLLATDLRNREIVLSKLTSRLANLLLLMMVGLPILGFLQFLGGVDPGLVIAGFAATAMTVLSLAALGVFFSVIARRARDAIVLTYLAIFSYLVLATPANYLPLATTALWAELGLSMEMSGFQNALESFTSGLNAGNIITAIFDLFFTRVTAGAPTLNEKLPTMVGNYALFHGGVALVCVAWSVLRLRAIYLKETYAKPKKIALGLRRWIRPAVGRLPMLWKEVFAEAGLQFHWIIRIFLLLLVAVTLLWPAILIGVFLNDVFGFLSYGRSLDLSWEDLTEGMNVFVRVVGTFVACLLLLGVAVRAATCISGERDRQTFDSLLTSPLDSNEILFAKWAGSVLSVRWGWVWLGIIAGLGLITQGLNPLAAPLLLGAWFVYASFLAILGLWFSTVSRTTLRAILWTLLTTIGIAVGHWVLWLCCLPIYFLFDMWDWRDLDRLRESTMTFQGFGLTPPATLALLAFQGEEFETDRYIRKEYLEWMACAVVGVACYALATPILWAAVSRRFREITGRTAFRRPTYSGPRRPPAARAQDRKPILITEEAPSERVTPVAGVVPPHQRPPILIEEEWRGEETEPRSG